MVKIFTHENRMIVWDVKNVLEAAGYEVLVKNEFAAGAIGDLSPIDAWPELWLVNADDYEPANQLLKNQYKYPPEKGEWCCQNCHEMNGGAYELCWQCGKERTEL